MKTIACVVHVFYGFLLWGRGIHSYIESAAKIFAPTMDARSNAPPSLVPWTYVRGKTTNNLHGNTTTNRPRNRCVYVDGYLRVEGHASFVGCENSGGGESSPGPGGAMYVGETGSVLFAGEVTMQDVSIIDNEGNNGGGIYNLGKVCLVGGRAKGEGHRQAD